MVLENKTMTVSPHFIHRFFFSKSMMLLLIVGFMDELISGVSAAGSPYILNSFDVSYLKASGLVLSVPETLTIVFVPLLLILSDHFGRKYLTALSLFFLGVISISMSCVLNFWSFLILLSIWGVMNSMAVGLSKIILIETYSEKKEQILIKWCLYGTLGDIATPLLFIVLSFFGLGWKGAFVLSGMVFILLSFLIFFNRKSYGKPDAESSFSVKERFGKAIQAMGNIRLFFWMLALLVATVLDEILISFAALHLHTTFAIEETLRNGILVIFMLATLLGYHLNTFLIQKFSHNSVLAISGLGTALSLLAFAYSSFFPLAALLFILSGVFLTAIYPIASARAFECLPSGQEGAVQAVLNIFELLGTLIPIGLGASAVYLGLPHTIGLIALAPFLLFLAMLHQWFKAV